MEKYFMFLLLLLLFYNRFPIFLQSTQIFIDPDYALGPSNGSETMPYQTLEEAFLNCNEQDELIITKNIKLDKNLIIQEKNITFKG